MKYKNIKDFEGIDKVFEPLSYVKAHQIKSERWNIKTVQLNFKLLKKKHYKSLLLGFNSKPYDHNKQIEHLLYL